MENFDIHRFFKIISNSKLYITVILLLFIAMGYFYSFHYKTPMYQSSATIVLVQNDTLNSEATSITQTDITLNQNLLSTYTKIAKSDRVLSQVIQNLGLSTSVQQLSNAISVKAVNNTEVFKISVSDKDATVAANITNELLTVFSNEVKNLYNMNNVYAMDTAEVAESPYNINHAKDFILFVGVGVILSFGLVMAIYLFDTTIKSEQDVEEYADLSVLSTIPMYHESSDTELIVNEQPKSPISECFKTFRTNIMFSIQNKELNTILVTSGYMSEGKSFVSANLAVTFAQSGKRVILVDTDMRKGRQHKIFNVSAKPGLSNCLVAIGNQGSQININEYVRETKIPNLHLMTAGDVPPNPSELLSSPNMKRFLEALNTNYDVVICDGTPCMLVSDSVVLSKIVDTTVIVTANKITKLDTLLKIKKSLQMVSANIGGVVVNKMSVNAKSYQNQYYYGNHNEINKKIEFEVSQTSSVLETPLYVSDIVVEDLVKPILETTIEKVDTTSSIEQSNMVLLKDMSEVKSQVQQIKDLYKTLMQSALENTIQKDNTLSHMMQEFTRIQEVYQTNMSVQGAQIQDLSNKIEHFTANDDTNNLLTQLDNIKEFYETSIATQHQEIIELGEQLSNLNQSDLSNTLVEEFSNVKTFYQTSISEQNQQIEKLADELKNLSSNSNSDSILIELNTIKEYYKTSIAAQNEQIETLKQKLSILSQKDISEDVLQEFAEIKELYQKDKAEQIKTIIALNEKIDNIPVTDNTEVLEELNSVKELYRDMLFSQAKEIDTLNLKLDEIEITDHSDIILTELNSVKESYQYEFDKQKEQFAMLEQKLEAITSSNTDTIIEEHLQSIQDLYQSSLTMHHEQIETLNKKIEDIPIPVDTTPLIHEMKDVYEINLQHQNEKLAILSDKVSSIENSSHTDLLEEFSKIYHQLERMNQRFDILEEKANHNETLIHHLAKTNEATVAKQEKLIDIKKLNAKVIQLQDYIEQQPIELPILATVENNIPKIKSSQKHNSILEGQLHIMDSIEETVIPKIEETKQEQKATEKTYVVDYERVQHKQKKGFNFFKKEKLLEEIEEPICLVSQILSGVNIENVG